MTTSSNSGGGPARLHNPYSLVQKQSIQQTLEQLSKETEELRNDTRQKEAEQKKLHNDLKTAKAEQQQLSLEIQKARVIAGQSQGLSQNYSNENARLKQRLGKESRQLKQEGETETKLLQEESKKKLDYVEELQGLNHELASILKEHEEERSLRAITDYMVTGNHGSSKESHKIDEDHLKELLLSVESDEEKAKIENGWVELQTAYETYLQTLQQAEEWSKEVHTMRSQVLEASACHGKDKDVETVTEERLRELESKWENNVEDDDEDVESEAGGQFYYDTPHEENEEAPHEEKNHEKDEHVENEYVHA